MQEIKKFVWIDLEMTGLDITQDVILEVAIIITDHHCNILYPGSSYIIHQDEENLENMNDFCKNMHTKNGLISLVKNSTNKLSNVEIKLVEIIQTYISNKSGVLAGNTVWQDRNFLEKYMPNVLNLLHYRLLDVSTVKELAIAWYGPHIKYTKKETHRALADVLESIHELQYYKKMFFKEQL